MAGIGFNEFASFYETILASVWKSWLFKAMLSVCLGQTQRKGLVTLSDYITDEGISFWHGSDELLGPADGSPSL
jgi:hypothetical protein